MPEALEGDMPGALEGDMTGGQVANKARCHERM